MHNFFHSSHSCDTLEEITPQDLKIPEGTSQIIAKGTKHVNFGVNITMEAYFAPDFSYEIIAFHMFSDFTSLHHCEKKSNAWFSEKVHSRGKMSGEKLSA